MCLGHCDIYYSNLPFLETGWKLSKMHKNNETVPKNLQVVPFKCHKLLYAAVSPTDFLSLGHWNRAWTLLPRENISDSDESDKMVENTMVSIKVCSHLIWQIVFTVNIKLLFFSIRIQKRPRHCTIWQEWHSSSYRRWSFQVCGASTCADTCVVRTQPTHLLDDVWVTFSGRSIRGHTSSFLSVNSW